MKVLSTPVKKMITVKKSRLLQVRLSSRMLLAPLLRANRCLKVASGIQQPAQKSPVFTSSSTQTRESAFICSTGSQTEPWEVPVCQPSLPNPPITVPPKQEYTRKLRSHSKGHPQNF
ncbi:UNVERIFIED_CONTAM: hypothetical protein FKN15_003254 [Acipenser sinensis]